MEKVAQTFIIYAAVKTAEEKARVELEKAKKDFKFQEYSLLTHLAIPLFTISE